jgi:hypothetical protein
LGGGIKEPGWLNTQLSKSRLAVVPGYSYYNFITSPQVPQIVGMFLADPPTNPPTGAAAASQASPAPEKRQQPGLHTLGSMGMRSGEARASAALTWRAQSSSRS